MGESLLRLVEARRVLKHGAGEVQRVQRARLALMVSYARAHSPYYRELYRGLPEHVDDPRMLPVASKRELMARFNDWVTGGRLTIDQVRAWVENPDLVGQRFRGRYTVTTTSGTTGTRGIFLLDEESMAVTKAMMARMLGSWLTPADLLRMVARGGRLAMVGASGGHFASAVAAAQLPRRGLGAKMLRAWTVQTPLPELVEGLNQFNPALLAPYASVAALLAGEQEAGRSRLAPVLLVLSAEGLPLGEYARLRRVFHAKVGHSYAATECPFLSYSCKHDWLHVNSDWAVLEPVDADHRPVPPGEQSHTALLSNLANRVQPILRYDIGDSVLQRPDPCPCGNPLPAIRVLGRAADAFSFPTDGGDRVTIAPLAFGTLLDSTAGVELFQILQTAPTTLRIRLRHAPGANPDAVWQAVHQGIIRLLSDHRLHHVEVERADEPPQQTVGGKYRTIIPLR